MSPDLTLSLYNIFVVKIEPGSFKTTTYSNNDITVLSQEYLARVTVGTHTRDRD